jgi:sulfate/thiosulfate transport system substrate-binding protein
MNLKLKAAVVGTLAGVLAVSGCSASASKNDTIDVVGFSILKTPNDAVFDAYKDTKDGKDVRFTTSYGASGDQSRAVEAGQKASYVHLSLESDVTRLVDAGKVDANWKDNPTKGVLTSSVVVFVVRPGNPDNIQTWDDLVKPGVEVITPNPASSGGARWNILAAWGSVISQGGSEADAKAYISKLFKNTINLPGSAREATSAFVDNGQGDVLLSYENEAILAKQSGQDVDYIVPPQTLLIENTGALLKSAKEPAKKFFDFLHTEEAQTIYAGFGFRPVGVQLTEFDTEGANDPANPFPTPETLLTIDDDFGGWGEAKGKYFDEENGIIVKLLAAAGKETE